MKLILFTLRNNGDTKTRETGTVKQSIELQIFNTHQFNNLWLMFGWLYSSQTIINEGEIIQYLCLELPGPQLPQIKSGTSTPGKS